jgi:hypothetical protein
MPLKIDWEGLIVAFESRSRQITHFFDRQTGEVEQVLERDAARHAALSADPRYVAVPRDQGERSRGDLEEFLFVCEDLDCRRQLEMALRGEAFAGGYREVLLRHPEQEALFFRFKERRARERAREWLLAVGVPFDKPASREM